MDKENYTVINNEKQMQFEIHLNGEIAVLEYRFHKADVALMHTEVPEVLGGRGLASALAHHALEWAKKNGKKVLVYCPFVATYLKKHPEYDVLVDKNVDDV